MQPPFTLKTSIDYITLSMKNIDFSGLQRILLNDPNISFIHNHIVKGKFDWVQELYVGDPFNKSLKIATSRKSYFLPATLKIEEPDRAVLNFIQHKFSSYNIKYVITSMELTFDYLVKNAKSVMDMHLMLVRHAYLKHPGKSFNIFYDTTIYLGNCRLTRSKAGRIYIKDPEGKARMELIFKRAFLKRHNIDTLDDIMDYPIEPILRKALGIKELDLNRYAKKYYWKISNNHDDSMSNEHYKEIVRAELYEILQIRDTQGINEAFRYMNARVSGPYDCIKAYEFNVIFYDRISGRKIV